MLSSIKRLFGARPEAPQGDGLVAWAQARGHALKHVREGDGLVVEGRIEGNPWRLEWGAPQRSYILDRELRLRMELGLPPALQMLVTTRTLAEELEQAAYAMFTDGMQTRLDSGMPEEMRWLSMFDKVPVPALKGLRNRFHAIASMPEPLNAWLEGELAQRLEVASTQWLGAEDPFVLMTLRGRAYLRMEALRPQEAMLDGVLALFDTAARRAVTVVDEHGAQHGWPATMSTAWQSQYPLDAADDEDSR
ncbi:hypothetical protein [Rivibacter subsaxonicus]|uniref:Uncharacterized protein n=1 Tax=Rivibacter subsaxonicus TaxID=457575 RepID=A0A4Q7VF44_9BURK|nr:hypothetical protein [Rivibacter subsaxonicus]RZT93878.1 hypothetical protein EV670_3435 [Rivibacter subsaxonicus]